jgi:hypothetical protein
MLLEEIIPNREKDEQEACYGKTSLRFGSKSKPNHLASTHVASI